MQFSGRNELLALRLSDERLEGIKQSVVKMYEKFDINCVPISAFEIATKMGVSVIPYSAYNERTQKLMLKKSEDGFVVEKTDGSFFIFYNDEKGYGRINNTIMHEIGHIILEHTEDSELADKEVKFFAKYALAPPVLIHKFALKDAFSIANVFDISYEAAGYALSYYHKWLQYGGKNYTSYELKTLELFKEAV